MDEFRSFQAGKNVRFSPSFKTYLHHSQFAELDNCWNLVLLLLLNEVTILNADPIKSNALLKYNYSIIYRIYN